ncbi:hypothetical protein QBC32DRAFT_24541 [Pseudoneurospora amorphoporcata]|uniref:Cyclin n=1 Tax=Pseudoneurospora amorphoporcata TaxID=241081 RepID=A0AAN6SEC1_9PEZI|nr:hypothetical protein QBC32DRAFT_24541 [Pseudoneurospora amorphoporcata]
MYLARTQCQNPFPSSSAFSSHHQSPKDRWTTQSLVSGWRRYGNLIKNSKSSSAGGLQTPPYDDDMATTYQVPNLTSSYEQHRSYSHSTLPSLSSCSAASQRPPRDLAHMFNSDSLSSYSDTQSITLPNPQQRSTAASSTSSNSGSTQRGYVHQHQQYQQQQHQSRQPPSPRQQQQQQYVPQKQQQQYQYQHQSRQPSSQRTSRPSSPSPIKREQEISARDAAMALHSLQVPSCISPKGGSLSDFVADLTALFWFETSKLLEQAATYDALRPGAPVRRIEGPAIACPNFKKWVHNLLSTTQVTQNVILLSLLYIHRLKVLNPKMHGLPGSEYRLLTVALMLANKFLDDNTYTNKTWSEVSQLSVNEIHVMEVEFLGNMRYSLLVTEKQWEEWLVKLARFREYMEQARQLPSANLFAPSPNALPVSDLPSPNTVQHFPSPLQPTLAGQSPSASFYAKQSSGQGWPAHAAGQTPIWNPASTPLSRKRSMPEFDHSEPPAKRRTPLKPYASSETLYPTVTAPQTLRNPRDFAFALLPSTSEIASKQARLSVSNLTLNNAQSSTATTLPGDVYSRVSYAPESMISLPPILLPAPGMASTYLNSTSTAAPIPSIFPTSRSGVSPSTAVSASTTAHPTSQYALPANHLHSQHSLTSSGAYLGSSPIGEPLIHTPMSSSPSNIYLQQRTSPYRPVRHAETLLHPTPSAFLQQYHLPNPIPPTQLHYQPLGRRNEVRTGIVPEFAMPNGGLTMAGAGRYQESIPAFRQSFSLPLRDLPPTTSAYSQQPRR